MLVINPRELLSRKTNHYIYLQLFNVPQSFNAPSSLKRWLYANGRAEANGTVGVRSRADRFRFHSESDVFDLDPHHLRMRKHVWSQFWAINSVKNIFLKHYFETEKKYFKLQNKFKSENNIWNQNIILKLKISIYLNWNTFLHTQILFFLVQTYFSVSNLCIFSFKNFSFSSKFFFSASFFFYLNIF